MRVMTGLTLALALGLAACKPAPNVDAAAEEQAIRAKETAWMAAYNKHDPNALAGQYEDEGSLASAGSALMTRSATRRAFLDGVTKDPALKVDFASDRILVAASGDLATSRGHYSFTFTDPETKKPKTEMGTYVTVYRKQADGNWLAVEDITAPGPAVSAKT